MADNDQAPAVAAAFPDPPPYYKHFTKANLSRLRDIQKTASNGDSQPLPDDLRSLVPSEPPADGKYRSFGVQHDLNQPDLSLSSAGITQIYPSAPNSTDPTPKLLALTRAIILNFLELAGILSINPEESTEKIEDLQTLFYNTHDLINQYRPHQARESLIALMEDELARTKAEIGRVGEERQKVTELLERLAEEGKAQRPLEEEDWEMVAAPANEDDEQTRREHQRALWASLDGLG